MRAAPHLPPWHPGRGQQGAGWLRRPLSRDFVLDHQVSTPHGITRVVEQAVEDRRGRPERNASHNPERTRRQSVTKKVALNHMDAPRSHLRRGSPEERCPVGIDLDSDHVYSPSRECAGDGPRSGTDLDNELAWKEIDPAYETLGVLRTKEVLAETATSLVSLCPLARGHGSPPLHPWDLFTRPDGALQRSNWNPGQHRKETGSRVVRWATR